jgi:hypothetical protein
MMRPYHIGPWDAETDMPFECHDHSMQAAAGDAFMLETPSKGLSLDASPNPFNPRTEIAFAMPSDGHVHLVVYDVRGRLVNVLAEGDYASGEYKFVWDGQDQQGQRVASGAYFARLETSVGSLVKKIALLK